MKPAAVGTILAAAAAFPGPGWGVNLSAAQAAPAIQIKALRARLDELEQENVALKARLAAWGEQKSADATDAARQHDDALKAAQALVEKTQGELQAAQDRLAQTEDATTDLAAHLAASKRTMAEQQRIIDMLSRHPAPGDGLPLWPWGAIAAIAGLGMGISATRKFWPRAVSQPLSVSVRLGEWLPQAGSESPSQAPRFSVRAELIPRSSSVRPAREPLVRELRAIQPGAAS